jgi:hypothetical protein
VAAEESPTASPGQPGHFARALAELGLADVREETLTGPPALEVDGKHFQVTVDVKLPDGGKQRWRIREDSRVWAIKGDREQ